MCYFSPLLIVTYLFAFPVHLGVWVSLQKAFWIWFGHLRVVYNIPLISGWISWGILFIIKLIFPLTRRILSLWNRCWIVIESFPQVALAKVDPIFFIGWIAMECQAPKTSTRRGTKVIPSTSHSGPYVFHFVFYACWTPKPGVSADPSIRSLRRQFITVA